MHHEVFFIYIIPGGSGSPHIQLALAALYYTSHRRGCGCKIQPYAESESNVASPGNCESRLRVDLLVLVLSLSLGHTQVNILT